MENINITYIAAAAAVGYVIYQARKAQTTELLDVQTAVRTPEYRKATDLFWHPAIVNKIYKDGPISWVAEADGGRKWIAYGSHPTIPPPVFQNMIIVKVSDKAKAQ
jgi:hypothetical protein